MYDKGEQRVCKAKLRPLKVDPYFEKNKSERPVDALPVKKYQSLSDNLKSRDASASKNHLGGVGKTWEATIMTLEQNSPERKFLT